MRLLEALKSRPFRVWARKVHRVQGLGFRV